MGNKRKAVPLIRQSINEVSRGGRLADVFCGMGCVAASFACERYVVLGDQLNAAAMLAKIQFLNWPDLTNGVSPFIIYAKYQRAYKFLKKQYARRLAMERRAMQGGQNALLKYIENAPHAGRSMFYRSRAIDAKSRRGIQRYQLTILYYSASYVSTMQAIEIDSLRYAIDHTRNYGTKLFLLGAWIMAVGRLVNAPGHTAQFLKPNSQNAYERIVRTWSRSVWAEFIDSVERLQQYGNENWRSGNRVQISDAVDLLADQKIPDISVVYADPPYTKDQYSRFYHLYESLIKYDFPDSFGGGRYPTKRESSSFSRASEVEIAFRNLFAQIKNRDAALVLHYPTDGLLYRVGIDLQELIAEYFSKHNRLEVPGRFSTLGSSRGQKCVPAKEMIFKAA